MAHDFNNLLTVILSCAATLKEELASGASQEIEDVAQIQAAAERARDLTRQLLAFARKQVIVPVPVDVNAILQSSRAMLARLLGDAIDLEVVPTNELWHTRNADRADPPESC